MTAASELQFKKTQGQQGVLQFGQPTSEGPGGAPRRQPELDSDGVKVRVEGEPPAAALAALHTRAAQRGERHSACAAHGRAPSSSLCLGPPRRGCQCSLTCIIAGMMIAGERPFAPAGARARVPATVAPQQPEPGGGGEWHGRTRGGTTV